MKQCTWCGKEYPDEAIQCAIDAYPLASVVPAPSQKFDFPTEVSKSRRVAAENADGQTAQAQPDWIDQFLRNRSFWCGLLLILYFLPALLAGAPMALAFPWIVIPNAHVGLWMFLGLGKNFHDPTAEIYFAAGFHLVFWPTCLALLIFNKRMPTPLLWILSWLMIVTWAVLIPGCTRAVEALGH